MLHVIDLRLGEDSVYHCGLDEAPKKGFVQLTGARYVGVGYRAICRDVLWDVVVVDKSQA